MSFTIKEFFKLCESKFPIAQYVSFRTYFSFQIGGVATNRTFSFPYFGGHHIVIIVGDIYTLACGVSDGVENMSGLAHLAHKCPAGVWVLSSV